MTRDEAIKLLDTRQTLSPGQSQSAYAVDALIALGVLKVDAPGSALDLLKSRLVGDFGYSHSTSLFRDLETALKACGLQVVAK